jgi:mannose-6-phosphate isomerase-like protein (cupin superfamily)
MNINTTSKATLPGIAACVTALWLAGCGAGGTTDTGPIAPTGADQGRTPWVVNIEEITVANDHFRIARWTGKHLQMTLMSLEPGQEIGLELHKDIDQFIRIEQGRGRVLMGESAQALTFDREVEDDWAIFIPAGYWHNVMNTGDEDLKLYSIYAPPEHPAGIVHPTSADAAADAHHHDHGHHH